MLGDRGAGDVEVRRDLTRTELTPADEGEDLAPSRCGDRLQRSLHGDLFKQRLTKETTYIRRVLGPVGRAVRCGT